MFQEHQRTDDLVGHCWLVAMSICLSVMCCGMMNSLAVPSCIVIAGMRSSKTCGTSSPKGNSLVWTYVNIFSCSNIFPSVSSWVVKRVGACVATIMIILRFILVVALTMTPRSWHAFTEIIGTLEVLTIKALI